MQSELAKEWDGGQPQWVAIPLSGSALVDHLGDAMQIAAATATVIHQQQLALGWATTYVQAAALTGDSEVEHFSRALLQSTAATLAHAANIDLNQKGDDRD